VCKPCAEFIPAMRAIEQKPSADCRTVKGERNRRGFSYVVCLKCANHREAITSDMYTPIPGGIAQSVPGCPRVGNGAEQVSGSIELALRGLNGLNGPKLARERAQRRMMSAAARKQIVAAQKARWRSGGQNPDMRNSQQVAT
jgi:hypothetical protein